jgi:predicted SnoaL-like aldol condensation-catalyzing enzyme
LTALFPPPQAERKRSACALNAVNDRICSGAAPGYIAGVRKMAKTVEEMNKALVLAAFDTLFNKRDYTAAERYWSPGYIQHSAHVAPGLEGLFDLVKNLPATLRYEHGVIMAEGDLVIVHGRFSGHGRPRNWIAADIVRIADGALAEHWDVLQDEATKAESQSGRPMFGEEFQA